MRIGMIGLGRMGANMSRRLALGGIDVVAFDASNVARAALDGVDRMRAGFGGHAVHHVPPGGDAAGGDPVGGQPAAAPPAL